MAVVAIVGILSTLAVYGVRKYIQSAKSGEAIQMLGSIKTAQESFKAETFSYLDVSGSHTLSSSTFYPMSTPDNKAYGWGDLTSDQGKAFRTLGVQSDGPVRFAYGCAAGDGSNAIPALGSPLSSGTWPSESQGLPWYVARAVGDLDDDGIQSVFTSANFIGQIIIEKEGE